MPLPGKDKRNITTKKNTQAITIKITSIYIN